jgi:hypothetical protein
MDSTFACRYECEVLDELPGVRPVRHFYYPGAASDGGRDGVLLRIRPESGDSWIATFAFGKVMRRGGLTCVLTTPNPDQICVVANGHGYLASASDPTAWQDVRATPVLDVRQIPELSLIVFSDFTGLVAYGPSGVSWISEVGADEVQIVEVSLNKIAGTWWNPATQATESFVLDAASGELIEGTRW